MKFLKLIRWGILGLSIVLGCYWFIGQKFAQDTQIVSHTRPSTEKALVGGPFNLIDQHGKAWKESDFYGKYMLVYFGYSYCPDICPLGLQNMTQALKLLGNDRDHITPIFITIDPHRDTVENLKSYATHFDPHFVMLTGSEEKIAEAIKSYKVYAQKHSEGEGDTYLMDHSTMVYLMSPSGKYIRYFPHSEDPKVIARGIIESMLEEKNKKGG